MAYFHEKKCIECNEVKNFSDFGETICFDCQKIKDDAEEDKHFFILDQLTIEQRLRKVEKWIYNYKPEHVPPYGGMR